MHAKLPKKNIHALARKNSFKGNVNKKKCGSKPTHAQHNFSNCPSLRSLSRKNREGWVWGRFEREGTLLYPVSLPCIFPAFLLNYLNALNRSEYLMFQ